MATITKVIKRHLQPEVCCPSLAMSQTCRKTAWILAKNEEQLTKQKKNLSQNYETFRDESENPPATNDPSQDIVEQFKLEN